MPTQTVKSPAPPSFHTIAEVAEICRVSTRTVRRWIRRGEIEAHRLGPQWRIESAALRRFLADRLH